MVESMPLSEQTDQTIDAFGESLHSIVGVLSVAQQRALAARDAVAVRSIGAAMVAVVGASSALLAAYADGHLDDKEPESIR
jgi:hypothetical protein